MSPMYSSAYHGFRLLAGAENAKIVGTGIRAVELFEPRERPIEYDASDRVCDGAMRIRLRHAVRQVEERVHGKERRRG